MSDPNKRILPTTGGQASPSKIPNSSPNSANYKTRTILTTPTRTTNPSPRAPLHHAHSQSQSAKPRVQSLIPPTSPANVRAFPISPRATTTKTAPEISRAQSAQSFATLKSPIVPIKPGACFDCGEKLSNGEGITLIDASSKTPVYFHRHHIACSVCRSALTADSALCKDGVVFCRLHWPMSRICSSCVNPIIGGCVCAGDCYYHRECFVCSVCSRDVKMSEYYGAGDSIFCFDHRNDWQKECTACHVKAPVHTMRRLKDGSCYHWECLKCCICDKGDEKLIASGGRKYCENDFNSLVNHRCSQCGDFIRVQKEEAVVACNENSEFYHQACLKCEICHQQLEEYFSNNGQLRCSKHSQLRRDQSRCHLCSDRIDDSVLVKSMGHKWHRDCYRCQFCDDPVDSGSCTLKNDKLCCQLCFTDKNEERKKLKQIPQKTPTQTTTIKALNDITEHVNNQTEQNNNYKSLSDNQQKSNEAQKMPVKSQPSTATIAAKSEKSSINVEPKEIVNNNIIPALSSLTLSPASSSPPPSLPSLPPPPRVSFGLSCSPPVHVIRGDLIGRGGSGLVYEARDEDTGEHLALKVMKASDAQGVENEIEVLRSLSHPHIVKFKGTRKIDDELHIYMEFVAGRSLDQEIKSFKRPLSESVMKIYLRQLLSALSYCHSHGVIHRDIKGKNILIGHQKAKLCDFGSAKRIQLDMTSANPTMNMGYTPLWLAPEFFGEKYNSKADIWSLGCVCIEMAAAKDPWSEKNFTHPLNALHHIGTSEEIPAIPATISKEGREFIKLMLTRDPNKRPSADELLQHPYITETPPPPPPREAIAAIRHKVRDQNAKSGELVMPMPTTPTMAQVNNPPTVNFNGNSNKSFSQNEEKEIFVFDPHHRNAASATSLSTISAAFHELNANYVKKRSNSANKFPVSSIKALLEPVKAHGR